MDISILEHYFKTITVSKKISNHEVDFSGGVSVSMSHKLQTGTTSVFIATLATWKQLEKNRAYTKGATYLICNERGIIHYILPDLTDVNVFILNTSIDVLIQNLDRGIETDFTVQESGPDVLCRDFWNDLKAGQLRSRENAMQRFKSLKFPVKQHIGLILIRCERDWRVPSNKERIELAISTFFPETNFIFDEKEWIIFYTQDKDTSEKLDFSYEEFSGMLKANSLKAAISYPCQLPEILNMVHQSTSLAFSVGLKMNIRTQVPRVFTYSQLNPYLLAHLCSQNYRQLFPDGNTIFLTHPDVVKIYYHDLEENDNLLEVLHMFLISGQSITIASKNLYMHRNTVHNKINRIKEIVDLDLEKGSDCFLLLISCILLKYQQECENKNLTDFF
ncbi:MAG: helix-turn-helix domain-containing protein [Treponemataceae bacterium]|nr:helix-turn-helix domain-containing protein [Treponemataceae bacterium]